MNILKRIKLGFSRVYRRASDFVKRRPLASLLIVVILLVALVIYGQISQKKEVEKPKGEAVKTVKAVSIGESPKATFQAKIEKSGVIKILAQSPGIVQNISVTEGQKIWRGQQLISLSSNYQGGNAASVQTQIAQKQYQNVLNTFDKQKELLQKQRDVASTSNENEEKMREITRQSTGDTNSLIDANQKQLDQMNEQLTRWEDSGATDETTQQKITTLQGSVNQLQGGINQLRSGQQTANYQSSEDNPPAKLGDLQKDITSKQLDVQEKSLEMNKEVARLQVSLAYINEATMYPASPFAGVVQRIYVHPGQSVNPGTPLAVVSSSDMKTTAVLNVPEKIAKIISTGEPSELLIDDKKIAVTPYYVSSEATDGSLYTVLYALPEKAQNSLSDGEYISINVPVDKARVTVADPFVPIDAVYQTQDKAFVLVVRKGKAVAVTVKLGEVFGDFVEVLSGLHSGDQVITDRTVVAGDKVKLN